MAPDRRGADRDWKSWVAALLWQFDIPVRENTAIRQLDKSEDRLERDGVSRR